MPAEPGASSGSRRVLRAAVQVAGFLIGLALLWYCATKALDPKNREQLHRLGDASAVQVGSLLGLSFLSLVINGTVFWLTLRPVKRVPYVPALGVNAIATLLALAPFKLSMLFRILYHKARDGLVVLTGGAWLAAAAVIIVAGLLPPVGASLWRHAAGRGVDGLWWAGALGGMLVIGTAIVVVAGFFRKDRNWARIERLCARFSSQRLHSAILPRAHEGVRMLADPWAVYGGMALRGADVAVQTARFVVAAKILGVSLPLDQAIICASAYFLIGAAAPTGSLGTREGLSGWIFTALGLGDELFPTILLVSATDTILVLGVAVISAAGLRLDKLVRVRKGH